MALLLYHLGRWSVRHRGAVLVSWMLVAVAVFGVARLAGHGGTDSMRIPGVESQRAYDLLGRQFPASAGESAELVFAAPAGTLTAPIRQPVVAAALADVAHQARVAAVGALQLSPDARIGVAEVTYDAPGHVVDRAALPALEATAARARAAGVILELSGGVARSGEQPGASGHEAYGLVAAVVVLLFAFGSVVAMGLPIGTALVGLATGIGVIGVATTVVDVPSVGTTLAAMIGLGVGIDYALVIVTRHREYLHAGMTVEESAGRALATAGASVLFAGLTVMIAMAGLAIAGIPFVTAMGVLAGVMVLVMVAVSMTLLPALLGYVGARVDALRPPLPQARDHEAAWARVGTRITRRPVPYLVGSLAVLGALAAPTLGLRLGTTDAGSAPRSQTTRRAFDLMTRGFGAGANGPLLVVLDGAVTPAVTQRVREAVGADPDVLTLPPIDVSADGRAALLTVVPRSGPAADATTHLVHRLRARVLPATLAGTGVRSSTGGETASYVDLADHVGARLPVFIEAVVGLSFLLLAMVFRSLLIPLKAALMNVLSIAAAYGVVVAVFQWGWGASLIGLHATGPVVPFIPMFMFAILFGLSMDYEVFLLSRMRETYLATGDNQTAVVHALSTTARVITSAALIMISVFGSFVLGDDPTIKMAGLGLAVAVLVDATVVRVVLVPAATALLGRSNWWLPAWLDRLLPHLEVDGDTSLPAPQYADSVLSPVAQPVTAQR